MEESEKDIYQKMIDFWIDIVDSGKGNIPLNYTNTAILRTIYESKFDSSLDKWKYYCEKIVSSRFLMGETNQTFRVFFNWAIIPSNIDKVLSGKYDNRYSSSADDSYPKSFNKPKEFKVSESIPSEEELREELLWLEEPAEVRSFRHACLSFFRNGTYISYLKPTTIKIMDGEIHIIGVHKFGRDQLFNTYAKELMDTLSSLGENYSRIILLYPGDDKGIPIRRKEKIAREDRVLPTPLKVYGKGEERFLRAIRSFESLFNSKTLML